MCKDRTFPEEDRNMKLGTLCAAAGLACPPAHAGSDVTALVTDSRQAAPGSLFICIAGLHTDGHTYIGEALRRGARCVLVQSGRAGALPDGVCRLEAADTRRACARLYNAFYGNPCARLKFIGVTGTNGKTTVTHMLRAILEAALCRCGLIGTVGCESAGRRLDARASDPLANMTTPDPPELYRMLAEMADDGVEYVLMEATSHALALGKLEPIAFEAGVFTNLTPDHLDFHGTMEAYAGAKAGLFRKCRLSVVNLDDGFADRMLAASAGRTVTCSQSRADADYRAEAVRLIGQSGVEYALCSARARLHLRCPVPGRFTVMNSMQAAACALELGVGAPAVKAALGALSGVRGRMERLKLGVEADFEVIIDYAHTPDALEKLLRTARDCCGAGQRVTVLFGCGGDRDPGKRPMMGRVAERYADAVIVTSDNSRGEDPQAIISGILSGMASPGAVTVIPDRREAIRYAVLHARPGDLLLLAGKGHEEYEINRSGRARFSEREIVMRALEERGRASTGRDNTDP